MKRQGKQRVVMNEATFHKVNESMEVATTRRSVDFHG
jgi:hypothetical protein